MITFIISSHTLLIQDGQAVEAGKRGGKAQQSSHERLKRKLCICLGLLNKSNFSEKLTLNGLKRNPYVNHYIVEINISTEAS